MSASEDVVVRAKAALSDYEWAKTCRVAVAPDRSYRLLAEAVAELEALREQNLYPKGRIAGSDGGGPDDESMWSVKP